MKIVLSKVFLTADNIDDISVTGALTMAGLMLFFIFSFFYIALA